MKTVSRTVLAWLAVVMLLTGCVTNPETGERELSEGGKVMAETAFRAATMRLIRTSTNVDPDRVIEIVDEIRSEVDLNGDITTDEIMATARAAIDFDVLLPAEREIIRGILIYAQQSIDSSRLERVTAKAGEVMTWIEEAARQHR